MKRYLDALLVTVLALSLVGCNKKEDDEQTNMPAEPDVTGAQKTIEDTTKAVEKTIADGTEKVEEVTAKANEAVADVKTKIADATSDFDRIVAGIKANIAANSLDKAALGLKNALNLDGLTGDQKGILQQLKEMIQKALMKKTVGDTTKDVEGATGAATKKLGGLVPKFGK